MKNDNYYLTKAQLEMFADAIDKLLTDGNVGAIAEFPALNERSNGMVLRMVLWEGRPVPKSPKEWGDIKSKIVFSKLCKKSQ